MSAFKTKQLILVRHGETAWNAEGRIQGMLDVPLNALGLQQAKCVADELARIVDVAEMVSSDLVRTRETATPIANATGNRLPIRRFMQGQSRLREFRQDGQ